MKILRSLLIVIGLLPGAAWAQTPTPAQMGITAGPPNAVQVLDSSKNWSTIGTVDPATHLFSPTLPIATPTVLGGVKPDGTTITVTGDGTISGTPAGINANTTSTSGFAAGRMMFSDGAKVQVAPVTAYASSSTDINAQLMLLPDAGSGYHGTVVGPGGVFIGNFGSLGFTPNGYAGLTDTGIGRVGPNALGLYNNGGADYTDAGTEFRAYNILHDLSNSEWGGLDWKITPNVLTIGTQHNGTGLGRPVRFSGAGGPAIDIDYTYNGYVSFSDPVYFGNASLHTAGGPIDSTTGFSVNGVAGVNCAAGSTVTSAKGIVTGCGTVSGYTLPTASTTVLGGVKVDGSTISINGSGVISGAPSGITKNTTPTSGYTAGQFLTSDGSNTQADPLFTSVPAPTNGPTVKVGATATYMGNPGGTPLIVLAGDATNGGSAWPSIGFQIGNFGWGGSGVVVGTGGYYGFSGAGYFTVTPEVSIHRNATRGIGVIATATPTSPTIFGVYNTYTDGSNGEWGAFDWQTVANTLLIGTEKNGTGSARNLELVVGGVNKLDYGVTVANAWSSIGNFGSTGAMVSRGTQPTITGAGGTCAVTTKVGGAWAGTVVLSAVCASTNTITWTGMPAVPNGYVCDAEDRTTQTAGPFIESASTTTGFTIKVGATSSVAADVLQWKCMGY